MLPLIFLSFICVFRVGTASFDYITIGYYPIGKWKLRNAGNDRHRTNAKAISSWPLSSHHHPTWNGICLVVRAAEPTTV